MTLHAAGTGVGDRIPDLELVAAGGTLASLRLRGRFGTVVVLVHDDRCEACRRYLKELAAANQEHLEWDGRVLAVLPVSVERADEYRGAADLPFLVLADPQRRASDALGMQGDAVLIADQWGEVVYVSCGGDEHALPTTAEITDWLRFLAIQCPECEGEAL